MKRSSVVLVGILLVTLFLSGCQIFISVNTWGRINGWVYVANSNSYDMKVFPLPENPIGYRALSQARVIVIDADTKEYEASTTTDSQGYFYLSRISLGRKTVRIEHPDNGSAVEFTVYVGGGSGQRPITSEPTVHYVIVGIDRYQHLDLDNFNVSANDARAIKTALVDENSMLGSSRVLIDQNATKSNIKAAITNAARSAKRDDSLVFYFSGYADKEIWAGGEANPLDHLVPYDGRVSYDGRDYGTKEAIRNSVITDGDLAEWLSAFPNKNITVILDVAYAETFIDGKTRSQSLGEIELLALKNPGYTVLTSTASDERNLVIEGENSLFTRFILDGLQEIHGTRIRAGGLFDYASDRMDDFASENQGMNVPYPQFSGDRSTMIFIRKSFYW